MSDAEVQPPEEQQSNRMLIDYMTQKGYDASDFGDDDAFMGSLLAASDRLKQAPSEDVLSQVNDYTANAADYQQWLAERQAPEPEPESPKWAPPVVDQAAIDGLSRGTIKRLQDGTYGSFDSLTQKYVAHPQHSRLLKHAAEYDNWHRDRQQVLTRDPLGALQQAGLDDYLSERVNPDTIVEQVIAKMQEKAEPQRIEQERQSNLSLFVDLDSEGKPVMDGDAYRFNAAGEAYSDTFEALKGDIGEGKAHDIAMQQAISVGKILSAREAVQAEAAEQPPQRESFLSKKRAAGSSKGTAVPIQPAPSQRQQRSQDSWAKADEARRSMSN